jgi:hypothetical protein
MGDRIHEHCFWNFRDARARERTPRAGGTPSSCVLYWVQVSSDPQLEPHTIFLCLLLETGELGPQLEPHTIYLCLVLGTGELTQLEPHTIYLCLVLGTGEL